MVKRIAKSNKDLIYESLEDSGPIQYKKTPCPFDGKKCKVYEGKVPYSEQFICRYGHFYGPHGDEYPTPAPCEEELMEQRKRKTVTKPKRKIVKKCKCK